MLDESNILLLIYLWTIFYVTDYCFNHSISFVNDPLEFSEV